MQYALLIYQPSDFDPNAFTQEEGKKVAAEYTALVSAPNVKQNVPLGKIQDAVTVDGQDGKTETKPGPYASAKRSVNSVYLVEAPSKDEAIALASRIPAIRLGGAVEVRPVENYW